ncbi:MAG: AAA domain-containing protein, partial [Microbacteriaceae bacterium]
FARLSDPLDAWADTRGVLVADRVEVLDDWHLSGRQTRMRRRLRVHGTWAPGTGTPKGDAFLLYAAPTPYAKPGRRAGTLLDVPAEILPASDDEIGVVVEETCPVDERPWSQVPLAIVPGPPPRADNLVTAIEQWGAAVVTAAPEWPRDAASDILRRRPPVTLGGSLEPLRDADDGVRAVVASLLRLDRSFLAVQGPPGTGKTFLAAHAIAELVAVHGWRIGVVAQSHKVVENVLAGVVEAGLDPALVAKAPSREGGPGSYAAAPFTELSSTGHAAFATRTALTGSVIGGTAWDFTNRRRIAAEQLDLLVIDEAGQFSLAATIAVGTSARRLLLLGDPQQLPQVSQGTHPAPVDQSALGHITHGHDVLPGDLGYFLAESRRMDAAVTAPVSLLAYEGALHAHAATRSRRLDGAQPGVRAVAVEHRDNATSSVEEAAEVVRLVQTHLGLTWTDPSRGLEQSPLTEHDMIVVTPYNAQVEVVRAHLDAAGLDDVRVGTVDKFQGQEAVISIVTLAASSPVDVPRGLSFLLSRNRLNVAISRAQWAAFLVYSPHLLEHLPLTAEGVAELSRFIGLVEPR